ncbi:MAG: aspartate--tRNA ligase [Acidobacteria bacterium]|nr:aspartate--tRNA ligase [Acidobacteriota bacterium]NIM62129.1 aspartate--tRNA ligase [Acidobacteriota bacterium]NIO59783.1 aspartate--tRNA ligase [Acidobacteriota bacterium]NIQ30866.1 aspartate--tRNA ligase [Acidobacteriota bacterium]NIQ85939.1 aspartate--tRNA ligase [Acidobacteriota bacterium]
MAGTEQELLIRTAGCGELTEKDASEGREVVLTGWVHRRRDLGQLIFIEMRDATGRLQVVFDPSLHPDAHAAAESLRAEYVIGVAGTVVMREAPNPDHPTGMIELRGQSVTVHNRADNLPIQVADQQEANEEQRLKHRYIDLRRPRLQHALRTRHRLATAAREVLDEHRFVEIETPMLTRSTPEGARDYLVPSRVHPGKFYALPQSPQLFKQLLMIAGFERYYQFARCFRDEDLRADRQPEFTQIDIEMSFVTPQQIYDLIEPLIVRMFEAIDVQIARPFPRMAHAEAVDRFGIDRPDTRFGMELRDVGAAAESTGFRVFDEPLADPGGAVRGIVVDGAGGASRKQLDTWNGWAREAGARGLLWIKSAGGKIGSSALKVLGEERCRDILRALGGGDGDAALIVAADRSLCNQVLGQLRVRIARERDRIPEGAWNLLWVEQFPLFEHDDEAGRYVAIHHPFTAPNWDEVSRLETSPGDVRSQAYDLVLNGTEIGGGSIRIHRRDVQDRVFEALGIGAEEAEEKFGFLLRALDSGAPPHGGIALGFDRICAMLAGTDSIREVIAFPKTTSASCLMTESPAEVDAQQLTELGLKTLESRGKKGD